MKPVCPVHKRPLYCPACIGQKGGRVISKAKREASRVNGRKRKSLKLAQAEKP